MQLQISTDGKINGRLGNIFQVTLDGTNGTLKFINFSKGDMFTLILKQDSSGSRTVSFSGVTWQAGQAPTLQTAANAVDVFQFTCDGTGSFRDGAGAPSRLPARLIAVGLATIAVVGTGSGMVGARLNFSQGNGEGVGNLPVAVEVRDKSGSELLTKIDGTGSVAIGSGKLLVGSIADDAAVTFKVANNGATTIRSTISGASTLTLSPLVAGYAGTVGSGSSLCIKSKGVIGYCTSAITGGGICRLCN